VRDRVSPWYRGGDRAAAEYTLNYVLESLVKMMSPITPFVAEKIYLDIYGKDSVHMTRWPRGDKKMVNKGLEEQMEILKNMTETMNSARQDAGIKLRWPVKELTIAPSRGNSEKLGKTTKLLADVIKKMGNVKDVKLVKGIRGGKDFQFGKLALGEVIEDEALLRELVRRVQISRKEERLDVKDKINVWFESDNKTIKTLKGMEEELLDGVGASEATFGKIDGEGKGSLAFQGVKIKFELERAE